METRIINQSELLLNWDELPWFLYDLRKFNLIEIPEVGNVKLKFSTREGRIARGVKEDMRSISAIIPPNEKFPQGELRVHWVIEDEAVKQDKKHIGGSIPAYSSYFPAAFDCTMGKLVGYDVFSNENKFPIILTSKVNETVFKGFVKTDYKFPTEVLFRTEDIEIIGTRFNPKERIRND